MLRHEYNLTTRKLTRKKLRILGWVCTTPPMMNGTKEYLEEFVPLKIYNGNKSIQLSDLKEST